jgi:CRISPR-associated protein Csx17
MTIYEHVLEGCAPVPLAGYLKALGAFRLVAEQKDPNARGFWRNERFVLKTRLTREELIGFLLNEFRPTPVISPWNGGSGFYFQEGKTKEKDDVTGKRVKTGVRDQPTEATRVLDSILGAKTNRLEAYREAILNAKARLAAKKFDAAPSDEQKTALIRALRSETSDATATWIDSAATVTQLDVAFPPILGSGGNDGNLDFSTTIIQAILSLIDVQSGMPSGAADSLLKASLFADAALAAGGTAISQFAPSAVGAPNSSVGFGGASSGNAWDIIFGLEGALVMSTSLARRIDAEGEGTASFPFMIARRGVFGAGAGNVAPSDENARGEFWAPLWSRPASLNELAALFREGRAVVDRKVANDALDFAQAVGQLGVDRGVEQFERYAFEQRYGNMHLGVPLGRWRVERNRNADLVAEITASGWVYRARSAVRGKGAPASMLALGRRLDDALFRLAGDQSIDAVQEALIAVGALAVETGRRPKLRESLPPPRLSAEWTRAAGEDDNSYEFALAAALAGLDATAASGEQRFRLPFRRHLAPMNVVAKKDRVEDRWHDIRDQWDDTTEAHALAVWTGRDLVRDMGRVLERRLIEAQRTSFVRAGTDGRPEIELPLFGWRAAPLAAVAAFLEGRTDDDRIAALASGLAWACSSVPAPANAKREDALPFAYATMKPLFAPSGIERKMGRRFVDPLPLVRLMRAGRGDEAVRLAQRVARGAGLSTPFADRGHAAVLAPERLAAALLFPVARKAADRLVARAYPTLNSEGEDTNAA